MAYLKDGLLEFKTYRNNNILLYYYANRMVIWIIFFIFFYVTEIFRKYPCKIYIKCLPTHKISM